MQGLDIHLYSEIFWVVILMIINKTLFRTYQTSNMEHFAPWEPLGTGLRLNTIQFTTS